MPPPPYLGKRSALVVTAVLALSAGTLLAYRLLWKSDSRQPPVVAVVRFDNETGNPEVTRFSDALTDDLVERLTFLSSGRYGVIGNGQVLRVPREQRDLNAIAKSLHARFIVLGQVQSNGAQTRILAHLVRMPGHIEPRIRTSSRDCNSVLHASNKRRPGQRLTCASKSLILRRLTPNIFLTSRSSIFTCLHRQSAVLLP